MEYLELIGHVVRNLGEAASDAAQSGGGSGIWPYILGALGISGGVLQTAVKNKINEQQQEGQQ